MEVSYTISEKEYVKANRLNTKLSKKKLMFFIIVILCFIFSAVSSDSTMFRLFVVVSILGGLMGNFIAREVLYPYLIKKKFRQQQDFRKPLTIGLEKGGIRFFTESLDKRLDWGKITKWREDNDLILIYQATNAYHLIPKRLGAGIDNIRNALQEHVGNAD